VSARSLGLVLLAAAALVAAHAVYQASTRCRSQEPGLRGELMRQADGTTLYYDGECWTTKFVTPTDAPLSR
jgi:hypothetical protein